MMKITPKNFAKPVYNNINRALLDVRLGYAAGRKQALKNNKSKFRAVQYGTISTYRNLKSSGNVFPAAVSGVFFFLPFAGAQPLGFVIGMGIQKAFKKLKMSKCVKAVYNMKKNAFEVKANDKIRHC